MVAGVYWTVSSLLTSEKDAAKTCLPRLAGESQRSAETVLYVLRRFRVVISEPMLVESNV